MLEDGTVVVHIHIREGMSTTVGAQQQRVATGVISGIVGIRGGTHQSTIGILAMSCRDTFRDNRRFGILADVDHLRTRIGLLIVVRNSDTIELCLRVVATQDA